MKTATCQERLIELFDADSRNDTAIAAMLGVSKQTISSWRNGTRSPKKTMLIKITEIYNVSIEWLMGFDVDREGKQEEDRIPIVVPDSKQFVQIVKYMSHTDYVTVMEIFEKTYKKMQEEGVI